MHSLRLGWAVIPLCFLSLPSLARAAEPAVIAAEQRRVEVIERVSASVVAIFSADGGGGGSGVVISPDGFVLTNFHVVQGAGHFMKCGLNNGVLYDAVLVGIDPTGDVAMVKLLGRDDFPAAHLGDSDQLKVGDWAYAMGNPFLLATDFHPTITYGIVSGIHRYQGPAGTFLEYTDCIQVDSSINPGNSGGPLFNDAGDLVGINGRGSFEKRGRVNSGAGYAISINQIKNFMDYLRGGRIVDHATLGATVATELEGRKVVVTNILEKSEAYRRGLRIDDEVISFAGRPMGSVNQFKNVLGIYPKGWVLPLTYRRGEEKAEMYVRLRGLHQKSELTGGKAKSPPGRPNDPKRKPAPDDKKPAPTAKNPHAPPEPPAEWAHLYVAKEGFANYYFNQLEQVRVLQGLKKLGDFSARQGLWKVAGKVNGEVSFEFKLADKGAGLTWGESVSFQEFKDLVDLKDEPAGTGGLLIAMQHVRLLLSQGAKPFTELYYLGSEPLDGRGEMVDVLVAELAGAQSHWYFSREKGELLGLQFHLDEDAEPCEIRFEGLVELEGVKLPAKLRVRHADIDVGVFQIDQFSATAESKTAPEEKGAQTK
jgi:S1-C subfamily serine protease